MPVPTALDERDVAGLVHRHQSRHAERGVRPEHERIEEIVVDAPVDHVDALGPLRRAHVDEVVLDEEVAAFDQLDPELVGQERVLVIGRVVDAGREQNHRGIGAGVHRRDRFQRRQQLVRIVLDRRDPMAREQFRKQPQHDFPVLQHVGDAGGRAGVVLEHVEDLGIDAHDVDAADMDVDVVRHLLAVHLRPEHRVLKHQVFRDHAGPQNLASRIDVAQIVVDGLDALLETRAQDVPFGGGQNARQHVEGNEPLLRIGFAVDREGDADAAEQDLGLAPAVVEHVGRHLGEPARQLAIGWPQRPVGARHLVERGRH